MNCLLIGVGAAGNKAVVNAVEKGVVDVKDTVIINSTSKDFPDGYDGKKIILSPNDTGCGKEVSIAREYAMNAIKQGKLNFDNIDEYSTVIFCTSVEGGTGSGATPILAKYFSEMHGRNTHVIAFTGFEEDVRGLQNTVEFFKNLDNDLMVQTIRNSAFLPLANNNKFTAEKMANDEMNARIEILSGQNLIYSDQNIDDTDLLKVANTKGYMTVEHVYFNKPLIDQTDFNSIVKKMIYDSSSLRSDNPGAARLGVFINFNPASEDAIDFTYKTIIDAYGKPFETFEHKQWDGKKEYIAIIVSGMQMPINEIEGVYNRYKEESDRVNKNADQFFSKMQSMNLQESNSMFDMIRPVKKKSSGSVNDFLSKYGGASINLDVKPNKDENN